MFLSTGCRGGAGVQSGHLPVGRHRRHTYSSADRVLTASPQHTSLSRGWQRHQRHVVWPPRADNSLFGGDRQCHIGDTTVTQVPDFCSLVKPHQREMLFSCAYYFIWKDVTEVVTCYGRFYVTTVDFDLNVSISHSVLVFRAKCFRLFHNCRLCVCVFVVAMGWTSGISCHTGTTARSLSSSPSSSLSFCQRWQVGKYLNVCVFVCLCACVALVLRVFICRRPYLCVCYFVCVGVCWLLSIHIFINHSQCLFICMFVYRVQQEAGLRPTHVLRLLWLESSCTDQGPHLPDMDKRLVFMGYRDKWINKHLPLCVPTFLIRSSIILLFVSFSFPAPPHTVAQTLLSSDGLIYFVLPCIPLLSNLCFSLLPQCTCLVVSVSSLFCLLSWVLFSASLICHSHFLPVTCLPTFPVFLFPEVEVQRKGD